MDFSKMAPYLKDPLILIGFFLFLSFSFARFIIKRGIVPQLPRTLGYKILKSILLYGFIIGLLIVLLGFALKYKELSKEEQKVIGGIVQEKLESKELSEKEQEGITSIVRGEVAKAGEKQTKLTLVDLVITKNLTFDFKLKNSGTDSAFLTDVWFVFYPGVGVPSGCLPVYYTRYDFPFSAELGDQLVAISGGRQIDKKLTIPNPFKNSKEREIPQFFPNIPPDFKKPFLISKPLKISQVVPPGGVDRFIIRFIIDEKYRERFALDNCGWQESYKAYAVIKYDGDKELSTPAFSIVYYPHVPDKG